MKISDFCISILGNMSNQSHFVTFLKKAGDKRNLGFRPKVRGIAKNPCDHPHGVVKVEDHLQRHIGHLMVN